MTETVDHPAHYNAHPSGVECIQVVEHMGFNLGNAIKYIWRADEKGNALEDLRKAAWYVEREIQRRSTPAPPCATCGGRGWVEVGSSEWNEWRRADDVDGEPCPTCTPDPEPVDPATDPWANAVLPGGGGA